MDKTGGRDYGKDKSCSPCALKCIAYSLQYTSSDFLVRNNVNILYQNIFHGTQLAYISDIAKITLGKSDTYRETPYSWTMKISRSAQADAELPFRGMR